jgi:hypothetical protein
VLAILVDYFYFMSRGRRGSMSVDERTRSEHASATAIKKLMGHISLYNNTGTSLHHIQSICLDPGVVQNIFKRDTIFRVFLQKTQNQVFGFI